MVHFEGIHRPKAGGGRVVRWVVSVACFEKVEATVSCSRTGIGVIDGIAILRLLNICDWVMIVAKPCSLPSFVLSRTVFVGFVTICAGHVQQHTEFRAHVQTIALLPSVFLYATYSRARVEPCALLVVDRGELHQPLYSLGWRETPCCAFVECTPFFLLSD